MFTGVRHCVGTSLTGDCSKKKERKNVMKLRVQKTDYDNPTK
jgi:hypothetical protein